MNARLALSSETLTLIELDLDRQLLLEYRRIARHSLDSILEKFFLFAQDFSLLEYRWFFPVIKCEEPVVVQVLLF